MIWIDLNQKNEEKRLIKNIWCDWLINYVPKPLRKTAGGFKDKAESLWDKHT